ncbi:hypothetical protein P0L94_08450 [Microbacter sp. GSS18]|nr:hypothetical protein P0L94_08450 [Microbacter sp. GSS18]
MKKRYTLTALAIAAGLTLTGCAAAATTAAEDTSSGTTTSQTDTSTTDGTTDETTETTADTMPGNGAGPGMNVSVADVSTVADLEALIEEAYGDGSLGLHRGHQPIEDILDEVLGISHDELHVRMEQEGQNLAAVADDLGVGSETLLQALVDAWSPAIDNLVESGVITQDEADDYDDQLVQAFTYRVYWDGTE